MQCPKCGKETASGLDFCTECGGRINEGKDEKKNKTGKKRIIAVVMLAVIAVCAVMYLTGSLTSSARTAEDVAIEGIEAYLEFDHDTTYSLFPETYTIWIADKYYGGDRDGFKEMLEGKADENRRTFEAKYGSSLSYSDITVVSTREYSASEISDLNEDFEGMGLDIIVNGAKKVKLKYTLTYLTKDDLKAEETVNTTSFVISIGGKWYLFDE